ncbi:MAG: radical SAM protein [Candidatus Omnitrophota bacterium]
MDTKVYVKHQSFRNFVSSLGSHPEAQRLRVLNALKSLRPEERDSVAAQMIKDLASPEPDTVDFKMTTHISDELSKIDDRDVCRYAFHRYRYDVYPKRKILDSHPPYLQIEPTSACNYRCVFCYQTDKEFTAKANGFMGSMTFELFRDIIDQALGKIEFFSLASRGEPFLCPDIDKMLEYCAGKFLGLKVNTNGSVLNERHCHAILAGGVNTLVISADVADQGLYSQLRVGGNLEKVLNNLKLFQSIKSRHYRHSKIITRVSGVKYGDDQDIGAMLGLWGDWADQVSFVAYNPWENVYYAPPNDIQTPCSDLWRRMFVWYDGKVNPCDTDYKSTLVVGQIGEKTLGEIWRSPRYEELRHKHIEGKRLDGDPCKRCRVI